jgi:diguanylate cyclase (GGDEF)-like protein
VLTRRAGGGRGREVSLLRAENARLRTQLEVAWRRLARERYDACHDVLTGLPNRRDLYERFPDLPAHAGLAAMMLDLDGFKPVNDDVGHEAGDRVLAEVGRRLWSLLGERWLVARLGGDEFAAVRAGPASEPALLAEAASVVAVVAAPVDVDGETVSVGCSAGIAVTYGPATLPLLLGRADAALARSKATGHPVAWHAWLDDDREARCGVRPLLRTRDLRRARYGDVSLLVAVDAGETPAVGRARVPAPRDGAR